LVLVQIVTIRVNRKNLAFQRKYKHYFAATRSCFRHVESNQPTVAN